jgi:NADP-dependent 3-hydroxy acid dehydrogenase YdfG
MSSLAGKTAVVTGASSGIGRAIAIAFGQAGAHVFLSGRTREPMEEARRAIGQGGGGRATVIVGDIRDPVRVRELVEGAMRDTGRLDIMVNNAGLAHQVPIVEGEAEHWRAMLETNVLALLVGCQAAVRAMRACGARGHVVNISSTAAQRPDSGAYGATKHAVNCISATLRRELENDTIRVVNVMPGAIATKLGRSLSAQAIAGIAALAGTRIDLAPGEPPPADTLERHQAGMSQVLGRPEDVARAVLYAVTQPIDVNVSDIVVRPAKQLTL